ncbi:MAG: beta-propeller fold lactonase family protein [Bacteroidales bacterium]|nr:beta-propeller fold lactonase family protein [Bacteroidales bacterium]
MRSKRLIYLGVVIVVIGLLGIPAHKLARKHVNYMTAVEDHPLMCTSCHLHMPNSGLIYKAVNKTYLSPFNLAISPDGNKLYVVAQESSALLVVDNQTGEVTDRIAVGKQPHTVIVSRDGKVAFVSNQWADNVYKIDLTSAKVIDTLKTGNGPAGLVLSKDEKFLYVVDSYSNQVSVIDVKRKTEKKRLVAGNNPTGVALSPSGDLVYVTSRRVLPRPYRTPITTEMTVIDAVKQRVKERKMFRDAYVMENVAFTPTGDMAVATLIRPKNLIPSIQVEEGFMMTHGFGIIEPGENGKIIQLLTDEPNAYYSDPFDVVISPNGKRAYISSSGVDMIQVLDLDRVRKLIAESTPEELHNYSNNRGISSRYVLKRISTGANPKGLVLSPDGKYLYVAERLDDKIAVINTATLETEKQIDLGGPRKITVARKGRRLFNNSGRTFQNQYGCYTCHPDAGEDGLVYNMAGVGMGRNVTNTQTLRDIGDIPPYKWNGHNQSVYKQDGMRFSTFLTRTEPFNYDDLDALASYIMTRIKNPPNLMYNPTGELTATQKRGEKIFFRTHTNCGKEIPYKSRCYVCHPPPDFTDKLPENVGSLSETDDSIPFDTPQLNNLYNASPYLHDGRALSLEEIWTKYDPGDRHGITSDMTKDQLNDLVQFLKSLRDAQYYSKYYSDEYKPLLKELYKNHYFQDKNQHNHK